MAKCVLKPKGYASANFESVVYWCQGCKERHHITVNGSGTWVWNGSVDAPTFTPSVKVTWTYGIEMVPKCCHSFVREGRIEFLSDCTHALAGKTVPMLDVDTDGFSIDTNRSSSDTQAASGETGATSA